MNGDLENSAAIYQQGRVFTLSRSLALSDGFHSDRRRP